MRFVFSALLISVIGATAFAQSSAHSPAASYIFGRSASEGFGSPGKSNSNRYAAESWDLFGEGFKPLTSDYGSTQPAHLRILIKDDSLNTAITRAYLETLAREKPNLMRLYKISNQDYNRLAAIAFGILGKETKFGASVKYVIKEELNRPTSLQISNVWPISEIAIPIPSRISMLKLVTKKTEEFANLWNQGDPSHFLKLSTWKVKPNSRGLTQIKSIPELISRQYCVDLEELNNPRIAAVTTLGFLAESMKITKNLARNRQLQYVTSDNIFDYVLYVYFGSMRQLWNPVMVNGKQINETATPERRIYIQKVKEYVQALAFFENTSSPPRTSGNNACRAPLR